MILLWLIGIEAVILLGLLIIAVLAWATYGVLGAIGVGKSIAMIKKNLKEEREKDKESAGFSKGGRYGH